MSALMLPERWKELRPLLDRALDLEGSERAAFLHALERDAGDLHADLVRLLERHQQTHPMDAPAAAWAGPQLGETEARAEPRYIGKRIGPYVLRRLVGSGGMGEVYAAERIAGGFRQTVAIKLIAGVHPGMAQRFAQERQILAELRHPNIPQLLDGGESEDGMPYFVLEYVDGTNLLDYCTATGADLDQRLALLVRVAEALAYAHRRRVLHRDIKPGNILVTADGTVKLLDFGIAKLLDDGDRTTLTRQLLGPMTPEYAAPEQFRGEALGVATDVYQFGVLMFRLLSGRSPYRVAAIESLEFARAVCDEAPMPLRSAAGEPATGSSGTTGSPGRRRSAAQRWRDLERIVARCMEKSPAQRYAAMETLIADIEAVRGDAVPLARRQADLRRRTRIAAWLLAGAAVIGIAWFGLDRHGTWQDPWRQSPALSALGLDRSHLHTSRADSEALLRRALMAEARGDLVGALALLESVHDTDPTTPVPALLLGYWSGIHAPRSTVVEWQARAAERLRRVDDPTLDLLHRFIVADTAGDVETMLRYGGALLELKPDAWFVRLGRAHYLGLRNLRPAALRELQQIEPARIDHRKLYDAIADRASFGDLAGARALAARFAGAPGDPARSLLEARLAFTEGDLPRARARFATTVAEAGAVANLALEARALLYLGVVEGSLGDYAAATDTLRRAQQRLAAGEMYSFAIDASLALAQVGAFAGDAEAVRADLQTARGLRALQQPGTVDPMIELFAARLLGVAPAIDSADSDEALRLLLQARSALLQQDPERARRLSERALQHGIATGWWVEEFALLRRELGLPLPALAPLDPPFKPYSRFASRWALGAGVAPEPVTDPAPAGTPRP